MQKEIEYYNIVRDILTNDKVNEMKKYRQHYDISTYQHCLNVSYISYKICKKLHWDYVSMARASLMHDLFLYDWREKREHKKISDLHAFKHPKIALENAKKISKLNKKEQDIIKKHMWPVTLALPRYKESYVITLVDKYSAMKESLGYYKRRFFMKQQHK